MRIRVRVIHGPNACTWYRWVRRSGVDIQVQIFCAHMCVFACVETTCPWRETGWGGLWLFRWLVLSRWQQCVTRSSVLRNLPFTPSQYIILGFTNVEICLLILKPIPFSNFTKKLLFCNLQFINSHIKYFNYSLRLWINRTMWLNYTFIRSWKITFLIYRVSFWKFEKRNKRQ